MARFFFTISVLVLLSSCNSNNSFIPEGIVDTNFTYAAGQLEEMLALCDSSDLLPRSFENGELRLVKTKDWCSGFFPGNLWYMYEYSRDDKWKEKAIEYTKLLEPEKVNGGTHDVGFKLMCSYGNAYRLTKNSAYRTILLEGAETLMSRYDSNIGCIRSWDHNKDKWDYPVIIDNMMNLELLYFAFRQTRDSSYYYAANSHAEKTLKNHFREDNSSYHVVGYDPLTGEAVQKNTHQGYSDESAWARGQAWALYGFTMAYRESGNKEFLAQSRKVASYILEHENYPKDGVPYWDFNDPAIPEAPRDASAAAIICSGLYELSLYVDSVESENYFTAADHILASLSGKKYLCDPIGGSGFILNHSVGNYPKNDEMDCPIVYADYYFLEANLRRMKILGNWEGKKADVIIKADDLTYDKEEVVKENWRIFADLAVKYNIKVCPGIVGSSLERGNEAFFDWIKEYKATGLFEFWNHGQLHKRWEVDGERTAEFWNLSKEEQMAYIQQTQDLAREKLGFDFVTFAAPYNWSDEQTALALEEFPEIKAWLYKPAKLESSKIAVLRESMLNIEYPVHNASFYHFFNSYYFYSNLDVIAIQGHPHSWDESRMAQFELFAKYFNDIGVETVFPAELDEQNTYWERAEQLLKDTIMMMAERNIEEQPITVTSAYCERSHGGLHDFFSEGDYWWPDSLNFEGPYVRRDGMSNPENFTEHREAMIRFSEIVGNLTSAFILTKDTVYSNAAIKHCRAWFTEPSTMMSPHLLYAQAIEGRHTGRGIGIIDAIHLVEVVQSLIVLEEYEAIETTDLHQMRAWVESFLTWMTTHPYGIDEKVHENNHGTCWNMQAGIYAVFVNNDSIKKSCIENYKHVLLPNQMAIDGSFPLELKRTKPYGYALFNLDAFIMNCVILSDSANNLWEYSCDDGRNIQDALAFMMPYVADKSSWNLAPDVMYWDNWPIAHSSFLFGSIYFERDDYFDLWEHNKHFQQEAEVKRNVPIRNTLIWK